MSKRDFLDSYSKEFLGIVKRAKNADEFHCIPCNEDIGQMSMDRCPKLAECSEIIDSSESQLRFVLPRILQNANFQQEPVEIDNRWPEIQNLNVYLSFNRFSNDK